MKTDVFPLNYFKSIWTPIQAFINRKQLSWPGMIVIFVFLNALMTIPVTLNFAQMDSYPLQQVYPAAAEMLEDQPIDTLRGAVYEESQLTEEGTLVSFEDTHFLIKENDLPLSTVPYTEDFSVDDVQNGTEFVEELSRQWFAQNQVFMIAFFSLLISVFLFIMSLFLIFGSAVFLYLTKSSTFTSISTYKESVNLLLNALALPTLAALVMGLIQFDIVWMLSIQTVGMVIMLLVIYFKTHFNDDTLNIATQE